jgi:hypothetical protein
MYGMLSHMHDAKHCLSIDSISGPMLGSPGEEVLS